MSAPKRLLQTRYVRRTVERAITKRLGYWHAGAVISCQRDDRRTHTVLLHLNSGGNSLAAEDALRNDGYGVDVVGTHPSGYGCVIRVRRLAGA